MLPDSYPTVARYTAPAIPESGVNLQCHIIEEKYKYEVAPGIYGFVLKVFTLTSKLRCLLR